MRKSILLTSTLLGLAALAGCSPYNPDLGASPYLCAPAEPRCPDDYECVDSGGRMVCMAGGSIAPDSGSGSGGFQCAVDGPLEMGDSLAMAYQTDVGSVAPMRAYGPISICPEGDKDHFRIDITSPNQGLEVITRWETGMPITNSLLISSGNPIATASPMGTNALRSCATNLPVNTYYVSAFSTDNTVKNNYRIEMKIVAACN